MKGVTPESLAANRDMVRELNALLQERLAGGEPDVSEFLSRHGRVFPGAQTLDDIIEQLAARMAQMQSLMASLSPEQRHELQDMMDALLQDDRLRWDLAQLAATLDQLLPDGLGQRFDFPGTEELTLEGALPQLGRLRRLDQLSDQLGDIRIARGAGRDRPRRAGRAARPRGGRRAARAAGAGRATRRGGLRRAHGDRLELTASRRPARRPEGSRRAVRAAVPRRFRRPRSAGDGRRRRAQRRQPGLRVRPAVRPASRRTLANALARGRAIAEVSGSTPADFEVLEVEDANRAATVLLVDMSRSMLLRGCFLAAKKVAIALDTLIRSKYPRDELHVVGFAYYAREIAPTAWPLSWHGYEYGTNLQHGLMLRAAAARPQPRRQSLDRGHHRRRADGPFRERAGRVQLPADAPDPARDAARGLPLHARRHHHQHVHAGALARAGRVRRSHDEAQSRPRLLRHARAIWANTSWSTTWGDAARSEVFDRRSWPLLAG